MGELGHVIELMQGARERYSTLYAEVRGWLNMRLLLAAEERWLAQQRSGTVGIYRDDGDEFDDELPEIRQTYSRVWVENPSRYRVEIESSDGPFWKEVGRRPWLESPVPKRYPIPPDTLNLEEIYDPGLLIAELWLEPRGLVEVAGREGIEVHGLPRPTSREGGMSFLHLDPAGDQYELVVDAERGVVLRMASRLGDEIMSIDEVTAVAFDQPIPDELLSASDDD